MFSSAVIINAQIHTVEPNHYNCEETAARFDVLLNMMFDSDERLFVIARLGKGEVSRELNHRRLYNVHTYFKERKVPRNRFVFAESESLKTEEGRVEFYLGSKLQLVSLVKRNKDICVDCCETGFLYYGSGKVDKPKRRNK